jgi:hypothetical protein
MKKPPDFFDLDPDEIISAAEILEEAVAFTTRPVGNA